MSVLKVTRGTDANDSGTLDPSEIANTNYLCAAFCAAHQVAVSGSCVSGNKVFVSSASYQGNLGGLAGANAKCASLAAKAGLVGTFAAWLSTGTGTSSASGRLSHSAIPYMLPNRTAVAANWAGLTGATLSAGINADEYANAIGGEVWTASTTAGDYDGRGGCSGFTNTTGSYPYVGISGMTDNRWTSAYLQFCDRTVRL